MRATCRLLHALLLGHIRSLPTLDDLRSMRHAFGLKASTASRASIGETLKRSPTAKKGTESAENADTAASSAAQAPTLRIAQRHLSGIPFWFEQQEYDEPERGGERAGRDSWSSIIRAVYTDAWGGDDGRVDGLDLLLTLCAVPDDAVADDSAVEDEGDEESGKRPPSIVLAGKLFFPIALSQADCTVRCHRPGQLLITQSINVPTPTHPAPPSLARYFLSFLTGIPFSSGLFRAFSMLAATPSSSATPAKNNQGLLSADTVTTTVTAPTSPAGNPHDKTAATAGVPCVPLPHLRAILEHGGGMTPDDASGICELVVRKEDASRSQRKMQISEKISTPATAAATGKGGGLEPDGIGGIPGEGVEATATTLQRLHNELNGVDATEDETKEILDAASRKAATDAGGRDGTTEEGHGQLVDQAQPALTVSFTTVSECKAVREWVRRGAYTLPAFDVTSGQRRNDIR